MLQPKPVKRVQYYSRHPHSKYVDWLLDINGITVYKQEWHDGLLNQSSRSSVDDIVMERIRSRHIEEVVDDTPSWVDAAFDVLRDKVSDVAEAIEEMFEEEFIEEIDDGVQPEQEAEVEDTEERVEEIEEEEEEAEIVEAPQEVVVEETVIDDKDNPFGGEIDYNSFTVRELQALCKKRGITIRGTKSEVVLRLRHHDAGIVDQPTKGETDVPLQEATDVTPDAPSQEAATEDVTQYDDSRQESPNYEEE